MVGDGFPTVSSMKQFVAMLVAGMLLTGTINTLLNKWQDLSCVGNCADPDPIRRHYYEQPIWQTLNMFIGEALCLLVFYASQAFKSEPAPDSELSPLLEVVQEPVPLSLPPLEGFKQMYFLLPTLCDLTATTLMNVGLVYISASIYQMLRGSVVLFTATWSVLFLNRRHPTYRWFALFTVFVGIAIVGLVPLNLHRVVSCSLAGHLRFPSKARLLGYFL